MSLYLCGKKIKTLAVFLIYRYTAIYVFRFCWVKLLFLAHLRHTVKVSFCDQYSSDVQLASSILFLSDIFSLTTYSNLKLLNINVPPKTLYQNMSNSSAAPNKMATRALDKNYFKRYLLNHWSKFKIISKKRSSHYSLPTVL